MAGPSVIHASSPYKCNQPPSRVTGLVLYRVYPDPTLPLLPPPQTTSGFLLEFACDHMREWRRVGGVLFSPGGSPGCPPTSYTTGSGGPCHLAGLGLPLCGLLPKAASSRSLGGNAVGCQSILPRGLVMWWGPGWSSLCAPVKVTLPNGFSETVPVPTSCRSLATRVYRHDIYHLDIAVILWLHILWLPS